MAMLSNLDLLRRVSPFSRLTVAQAEAIGSAVVKRRFKRGRCWWNRARSPMRSPVADRACPCHGRRQPRARVILATLVQATTWAR